MLKRGNCIKPAKPTRMVNVAQLTVRAIAMANIAVPITRWANYVGCIVIVGITMEAIVIPDSATSGHQGSTVGDEQVAKVMLAVCTINSFSCR